MSNSLLNISAIVFGVFFIAFLFAIISIIRDNYRKQYFKKKDTSTNLPLDIQEECLLTSDALKDFPIADKAMKEATIVYSGEFISTTRETTIKESAQV